MGVLYYVDGASCTLKNNQFVGNTVNCANNGATVYLGFTENNTVTGNVFKNNTVKDSSTSKRVSGGIFFGYEAEVSGNVFEGNSAENANGKDGLGQSVCTSVNYAGTIDLSGNYFDGAEPVEGVDYMIQHKTGSGTFQLTDYFTDYTIDTQGKPVLQDKQPTDDAVAQIGDAYFATVQAALTAAQDGDTVTILAGTHVIDSSYTNGLSLTADNVTVQGEQDENGENLSVLKFTALPRWYAGFNYNGSDITIKNLDFVVDETCADPGLWCDNVLGYYYENVGYDRAGLQVTGCNFVNESEASLIAIMANLGEFAVKDSTFTGFSIGTFCDSNSNPVSVTFDGNTYTDTPTAITLAWNGTSADDVTSTVAVTNNTFNDDSIVSIHDYSENKGAIESVVITGNTGDADYAMTGIEQEDDVTLDEDMDLVYNDGEKNFYRVSFNIPAGASVQVEDDGIGITVDGVYTLPDGTYTYSVTKPGYLGVGGSFTVDGDSVTVTVELRAVTNGHDKDAGTTAKPAAPVVGVSFTDVAKNAFYADAVAWAVNNGITTGTSATTFSPNAACTRAQVVTFLWRAAGSPAPKSSSMPFADVAANAYYHDAVLWAVENGITTGTGADSFSPDAACTREQIVTFLWRAEGKPAASGKTPFGDVAANAYYHDAVLWAVENGITTGMTATTFAPDAVCTRGQIVTFLYRSEN